MIQGGGFEVGMNQKEVRASIKNEANNGVSNETGTVAMARTNDPHSATAQFFINVKDNNFLDHTAENANGWGYCVFGKVVDGMSVIEEMKTVATGNSGGHVVSGDKLVGIAMQTLEDGENIGYTIPVPITHGRTDPGPPSPRSAGRDRPRPG